MIEVSGLARAFGSVQAVESVSLAAPDGRITGLLGPNGAGKSTTLRAISSVIGADAGEIRVDGVDVSAEPGRARRAMGVLPHKSGLYPRLTGRENIAYYGRLNGLAPQWLEQRIETLVAKLDMAGFVDRPAQGYSQGQQLKTALARAMVHDPRNLILDEPTNGLDVMATRAMRDVIRRLRDEGHCVLFSSHVMQEVAALCDRILIIAAGRVVAEGSPEQLREQMGTGDLEEAFVRAIEPTERAS